MKKLAILSMIFCLSFFNINASIANPSSPNRIVEIMKIQGKDDVLAALHSVKTHPSNQLELGILYFKLAEEKRNNKDNSWFEELKKAYTILSILKNAPELEEELKPYVGSYHAAAMAWLGASTHKTRYVAAAWEAFDLLQKEYGNQEVIVGLLQAKTAAELPYFHNRKYFANKIINQMIQQFETNTKAYNPLLMSQVYRYWSQLHPKNEKEAANYLKKAKVLEKQAV